MSSQNPAGELQASQHLSKVEREPLENETAKAAARVRQEPEAKAAAQAGKKPGAKAADRQKAKAVPPESGPVLPPVEEVGEKFQAHRQKKSPTPAGNPAMRRLGRLEALAVEH